MGKIHLLHFVREHALFGCNLVCHGVGNARVYCTADFYPVSHRVTGGAIFDGAMPGAVVHCSSDDNDRLVQESFESEANQKSTMSPPRSVL